MRTEEKALDMRRRIGVIVLVLSSSSNLAGDTIRKGGGACR